MATNSHNSTGKLNYCTLCFQSFNLFFDILGMHGPIKTMAKWCNAHFAHLLHLIQAHLSLLSYFLFGKRFLSLGWHLMMLLRVSLLIILLSGWLIDLLVSHYFTAFLTFAAAWFLLGLCCTSTILYLSSPAGVATKTTLPAFSPRIALPTGDSLEIRGGSAIGSASVVPTIL